MKIYVLVNITKGHVVGAFTKFEIAKVNINMYERSYPQYHYMLQETRIQGDI